MCGSVALDIQTGVFVAIHGVFPWRTVVFCLLTVTTAYCRKGRPFIMLGRPLSFALESEGRRMRPLRLHSGQACRPFFRDGVFLDRPGGPTYQSPVLQHWENRELS